jgi:hypothetical protein
MAIDLPKGASTRHFPLSRICNKTSEIAAPARRHAWDRGHGPIGGVNPPSPQGNTLSQLSNDFAGGAWV